MRVKNYIKYRGLRFEIDYVEMPDNHSIQVKFKTEHEASLFYSIIPTGDEVFRVVLKSPNLVSNRFYSTSKEWIMIDARGTIGKRAYEPRVTIFFKTSEVCGYNYFPDAKLIKRKFNVY